MNTLLYLLPVIFLLAWGGFSGFARGETFPGTLGLTQSWLFQESKDGRWTLHRWGMVITAGMVQAWLLWLGADLPWWAPLIVWGLVAAAWSLPHSPIVPNSQWMIMASGLAMTLPPAIALAITGHWLLGLGAAAGGAVKPAVYWVCNEVTPAGKAFPEWWTVEAEIVNGMLEVGLPAILILAAIFG